MREHFFTVAAPTDRSTRHNPRCKSQLTRGFCRFFRHFRSGELSPSLMVIDTNLLKRIAILHKPPLQRNAHFGRSDITFLLAWLNNSAIDGGQVLISDTSRTLVGFCFRVFSKDTSDSQRRTFSSSRERLPRIIHIYERRSISTPLASYTFNWDVRVEGNRVRRRRGVS